MVIHHNLWRLINRFPAQLNEKKIDNIFASSSLSKICISARCSHGIDNGISNFLNSVFVAFSLNWDRIAEID